MDIVRADAEPVLRVLLVERDPVDTAVLAQVMRASQAASAIVTAASFSAAEDVLRREAIDAIFCSVAMQDIEVFRSLIRTAKPRPVVALVAEAGTEIRNLAIQAGAVCAVCKERLLASFAQLTTSAPAGLQTRWSCSTRDGTARATMRASCSTSSNRMSIQFEAVPMPFFAQLWRFLCLRKKYWLLPAAPTVALFGSLSC